MGVLVGMKQTDMDFYCSKKGERIKGGKFPKKGGKSVPDF